ncbi:MAG: ABC transporter substrate-binding protein [Geminicoccaceae bacterium]
MLKPKLLDRRRLLAATAAGLVASPFAVRRSGAQNGPTELTFAFAEDESGAIQSLIDNFNTEHEGRIRVSWQKAPEQSDAFFRLLQSDFEAGSDEIDVFGADVIWTAEFASKRWIQDLSRRIYADLSTDTIIGAALNSVVYRNRLWAVPWYTDAGMLFYRRDLLDEAGISEPPATWDELAEIANRVRDATGTAHGLVFQGDRYEGGVTNALEFIWSAGGRAWTPQSEVAGAFGARVSEPNVVVLNSRASVAGFAKARELVETGVAPEDVATFDERDALAVFAAGDAVFMRNWPFAYGLLGSEEFGPVTQDQVGIAPIPTLREGARSYSCLGGWNLAVNARSTKVEEAWTFIRWATETERQRAMAETGGFLPVSDELYDDQALTETVPVMALGRDAVRSSRARPISTIYSRLSPRLAIAFNRVLTGEVEPLETIRRTEDELQRIINRSSG